MLHVDGLQVRYGEVVALSSVDLRLRPGTVTGLIGVNGSGKSTLMKSVVGLVHPQAGTISIGGEASAAARKRSLVGYVPQAEDIDPGFPVCVRDVVTMGRYGGLGITRRARPSDVEAVDEAIARVGLADLAGRQIGRLSGGQRKRAFVARALAQGARLLLLDEPFSGVDARSEATIRRVLRAVADGGGTVLVATHDLDSLPTLADEVVLLNRTVLRQGRPDDVLRPEVLVEVFG